MNFAYLINANEIFLHEPIGQPFFNLRQTLIAVNGINIARGSKIKARWWALISSPGQYSQYHCAHALHIKSTEWVKLGVPLGLVIMTFTAVVGRTSLAGIWQISLPEDQDRELLKLGFRA
jgi:hypothetical protein